MTARLTAADARALFAKPKRSKYGAVRTPYNGRVYASKLEANHAAALDAQKRAGLIRGWLPQVSLPLPGTKRRIVVDFLVIRNDGTISLQDTKGIITKDWKLKAELIEGALGVTIDIVRRTR